MRTDGQDGEDRPRPDRDGIPHGIWSEGEAELWGVFGPVAGGGDAGPDRLAWGDEPPWQPVVPGDAPRLLSAYRVARMVAEELRLALARSDLSASEFPDLCGAVDADGLPVVELGRITVTAAARLVLMLERCPEPPARHGGGRRAA